MRGRIGARVVEVVEVGGCAVTGSTGRWKKRAVVIENAAAYRFIVCLCERRNSPPRNLFAKFESREKFPVTFPVSEQDA